MITCTSFKVHKSDTGMGVSGVQCNGSAYFCYCLIVRLINTTGWTEALCNNSRGLEMALHCFLC